MINKDIHPFYINGLSRKDEVVIHRIRLGHTWLTHSHLMEDRPLPLCFYCHETPIPIKHIMIECDFFTILRNRFYEDAVDMRDLFERFSLRNILEFLKRSNLYKLI